MADPAPMETDAVGDAGNEEETEDEVSDSVVAASKKAGRKMKWTKDEYEKFMEADPDCKEFTELSAVCRVCKWSHTWTAKDENKPHPWLTHKKNKQHTDAVARGGATTDAVAATPSITSFFNVRAAGSVGSSKKKAATNSSATQPDIPMEKAPKFCSGILDVNATLRKHILSFHNYGQTPHWWKIAASLPLSADLNVFAVECSGDVARTLAPIKGGKHCCPKCLLFRSDSGKKQTLKRSLERCYNTHLIIDKILAAKRLVSDEDMKAVFSFTSVNTKFMTEEGLSRRDQCIQLSQSVLVS